MPTGRNYQGRDGRLRLLDNSQGAAGNAATPFGYEVSFSQMDLSINYQQRPEELMRLDRQRITNDAHYQVGSEENLLTPVDVTFSMICSSQENDAIMDFIGVNFANNEGASTGDATNPWNVKGTPTAGLVTTKGRGLASDGLYAGGRIDAKGSAIKAPVFADKKKVCIDAEAIWQERDGTNLYGIRMKEMYFEPGRQSIGESADFVVFNLTASMYGEAERITAFSRARNVLKGINTLF